MIFSCDDLKSDKVFIDEVKETIGDKTYISIVVKMDNNIIYKSSKYKIS